MTTKPRKVANSDLKNKELNKANPEIGYRITAGEISFVGRKMHNALVYHAQRLTLNGKGKLPGQVLYNPEDIPNYADRWWAPLSDIINDCTAGGRNHQRVKDLLVSLMGVVVERNETGWEAHQIISGVKIVGTRTMEGGEAGDKLFVGWNFPREIEPFLIQPYENDKSYTRLSLYYQSYLKTEAALVLYEICKRYATFPRKTTNQLPWQEWAARFNTKNCSDFPYFNRDVLKPAIDEINGKKDEKGRYPGTDITIQVVPIRGDAGKKITHLEFKVELKPQSQLEITPGQVILSADLVERLEKIGISPAQTQKILNKFGEEDLTATLDLVEKRLLNKDLPTLERPGAYFTKALKEGYSTSEQLLEIVKKAAAEKGDAQKKARLEKSQASFDKPKRAISSNKNLDINAPSEPDAGYERFLALSDDAKDAAVIEFSQMLPPPEINGLLKPWAKTKKWSRSVIIGKRFFTWWSSSK